MKEAFKYTWAALVAEEPKNAKRYKNIPNLGEDLRGENKAFFKDEITALTATLVEHTETEISETMLAATFLYRFGGDVFDHDDIKEVFEEKFGPDVAADLVNKNMFLNFCRFPTDIGIERVFDWASDEMKSTYTVFTALEFKQLIESKNPEIQLPTALSDKDGNNGWFNRVDSLLEIMDGRDKKALNFLMKSFNQFRESVNSQWRLRSGLTGGPKLIHDPTIPEDDGTRLRAFYQASKQKGKEAEAVAPADKPRTSPNSGGGAPPPPGG